jgi:hypothetical protein
MNATEAIIWLNLLTNKNICSDGTFNDLPKQGKQDVNDPNRDARPLPYPSLTVSGLPDFARIRF